MADERGSTHAKRAAYDLRQRILKGEMPGGTRLYEVALADEMAISRTPVREAMSRLAEEGLLGRATRDCGSAGNPDPDRHRPGGG